MFSYGAVAYNIRRQKEAAGDVSADFFEALGASCLEVFETVTPEGRIQQVQWLRALGKIVTAFEQPTGEEAMQIARFRRLCRLAMVAVRNKLPEAAMCIRLSAGAVELAAPRCSSAHKIGQRLVASLGPKGRDAGVCDSWLNEESANVR